jgi:hypothetical protein
MITCTFRQDLAYTTTPTPSSPKSARRRFTTNPPNYNITCTPVLCSSSPHAHRTREHSNSRPTSDRNTTAYHPSYLSPNAGPECRWYLGLPQQVHPMDSTGSPLAGKTTANTGLSVVATATRCSTPMGSCTAHHVELLTNPAMSSAHSTRVPYLTPGIFPESWRTL